MQLRPRTQTRFSFAEASIKTSVYLVDIDDWERLNQPYIEFFGDPLPARTALAVAALPRGARVEIEAWAVSLRHDA